MAEILDGWTHSASDAGEIVLLRLQNKQGASNPAMRALHGPLTLF
jgi:hypothetical protein